jgi:hypothetical protein
MTVSRRTRLALCSLALTVAMASAFHGARYEPPDGYIYHGVGWQSAAQQNYLAMMPPEEQPLLHQMVSSIPGSTARRGMTVASLIQGLNPAYMPEGTYAELSVHFAEDEVPVDTTFWNTTVLDHYIDTLAEGLIQHGDPVFLRIGLEMNGAWNGYTPWVFPRAYRKLVEGLRARGVTNIATVWCYEPDAPADFADSAEEGWKWYPGDDVVDWFGLDPFPASHFDPSLPDTASGGRGDITEKGKSELFLQFAEARGKPVYLNETTAHSVFITPDADDSGHADGMADWAAWFEPWFEFLALHPNIKAFNYINLDWTPYDQWSHWGDARLEINSYISANWISELSDPKFLHAGYDIAATPVVSPQGLDRPDASSRRRAVAEGDALFDLCGRRTDSRGMGARGVYLVRAPLGSAERLRRVIAW